MRLLPLLALALATLPAEAQSRPRARDLGIDLGGTPGAHNAITDGATGIRVHALPADRLVAAMRNYGRLP